MVAEGTYDGALHNLQTAEARLKAAKANLDLTRDQLNYTEAQSRFRRRITAVGAEAGQNVNAGQMVVGWRDRMTRTASSTSPKRLSPTAATRMPTSSSAAVQPDLTVEGVVRGYFSGRRSGYAHLHRESHTHNPPQQLCFGMNSVLSKGLPLSRSRCRYPPYLRIRLAGCLGARSAIEQSHSEAHYGRAL